jgi:hypothetical protein
MPIPEVRTRWAEEQAEQLLAIPFISEFVFRSPQNLSGPRGTQREVADHLILNRGKGLLVSQKTQENPESRDERRNGFWVLNNAKSAVAQLIGALRSPGTPFWCDHPRRGRVDFPAGLPPIAHGVVIVETFRPVDLQPAAADLPLEYAGTPITYLSINDFINVAMQLRTVPEVYAYLDARKDLPDSTLRRVGEEQLLLEYFLLHETFKSCRGHEDAAQTLGNRAEERNEVLERMVEYRQDSSYLEYVTNALATRSSTCLEEISPEWVAKFDPKGSRSSYLRMQELFTDLGLRERALLGKHFESVIRALAGRPEGYVHSAVRLDSKPDWVFIFGSAKKVEREEIFRRMESSIRAALAFYQKQRCMVVIDRDGDGYEVSMTHPDLVFTPSPAEIQHGWEMFGHLRIASVPVDGF